MHHHEESAASVMHMALSKHLTLQVAVVISSDPTSHNVAVFSVRKYLKINKKHCQCHNLINKPSCVATKKK